MDTNKILADFQFLDNRVVEFNIQNKELDSNNKTVKINYNMNYKIISCRELEDKHLGLINLIINLTGKGDESEIFQVHLTMEGRFVGDKSELSIERFRDMLEVNGVATLSQISRAYLTSVTSLSGMVPINLPMVNIYAMKKLKEDNQHVEN